MQETWKACVPDMVRAVREAGAVMRGAHDLLHRQEAVEAKPGTANFVTVYDKRVQQLLLERLGTLLPQARFIAEEQDNSGVDLSGLCFVIDPIDGTTNFIHDYGCSTVSVALLEAGTPVFAAVYNPYVEKLYTAVRGEGACCNGEPVGVSDVPLSNALVLFGTTPYDKPHKAKESFAAALRVFVACADIRRSGSAAWDICQVAAGRAEAFFEAFLSPWDYAGGLLILQEAGGTLTQFDGAPVRFDRGGSVLAATPAVAAGMRALLANEPLGEEEQHV